MWSHRGSVPARCRRALLGTAAALVAVPLSSAPAPAVTTDQSYPVPASGIYTVDGHGFGHGHGMSQYGAYGAARAGLDYRQIMDFYYPGTSWGTARGSLRVLVSADTTRDVVVSPASGLAVRDLGSGTTYPLPAIAGVTRWRLNVSGARTVVGYFTGAWHRYHPGSLPALAGDGELRASGPLTLWTPSGSRVYRGSLRAASPYAGSADRDTVNVVSLDDYVRGVIPAEMPASWSTEAVKAQAVAARTYATWSRDLNPKRYYQICDTTACQVYRGATAEEPRADAAVAATARRILTYQGEPAFTQFSASNGGWSTVGSRPYLVARADPYDGRTESSAHAWTLRLSAARIQAAFPGIGALNRLRVTRRDGHGEWGGRVVTIVLDGRRKDVTLSGDGFRSVFGLRSSWFAF
jgi:stage II sporulation protein D